ncbi:hypothetical protein E2I00_013907, partial [Balaenoptera physalus]
ALAAANPTPAAAAQNLHIEFALRGKRGGGECQTGPWKCPPDISGGNCSLQISCWMTSSSPILSSFPRRSSCRSYTRVSFVWAGGMEGPEGLGRKQACLAMLLHFLDTYQGLLQEEEGAGRIIKDLYLLIMKDESLYQDLREDTLRLHQLVETVELKIPDESQLPSKQVKPLFRHFRRIDSCLQTRVAFRGSDEIFCRVYMPDHSYVTIRSRLSASVQDILGSPTEDCVFTTLGINSHLFACTRDSYEALVPLPEEIQVSPGDTEIHRGEPEDVANNLTAFHWELFRCVHEKLPGKFKNLFRKFENLTVNLTFLHEGSKTLVDGLVNIEKLDSFLVISQHSVAEKVRTVRKYRSRPLCLDMEASPHHLQTKAYVRQFQVIDNQNLLFELSYKLEAN